MSYVDLHDPAPFDSALTPAELKAAALYVCSQAENTDDARELLDMLGLVPR